MEYRNQTVNEWKKTHTFTTTLLRRETIANDVVQLTCDAVIVTAAAGSGILASFRSLVDAVTAAVLVVPLEPNARMIHSWQHSTRFDWLYNNRSNPTNYTPSVKRAAAEANASKFKLECLWFYLNVHRISINVLEQPGRKLTAIFLLFLAGILKTSSQLDLSQFGNCRHIQK